MANPFLNKKVLVITAHPDDESPLAAGTIRQVVDSGGEVRLLCATYGEKGRAHLREDISTDELKNVRFGELERAANALGLSSVEVLDLGDGQVAEKLLEFEESIAHLIQNYAPDMLISFGPDGYTGHKDHVATHVAAVRVAQKQNIPLYMFCLPPEPWREDCLAVLRKKRKFGSYHDHEVFALPTVDIVVEKEAKLTAIQCHKTQLAGLDPYKIFSSDYAEHTLTHEYFSL